MSDIENKAKNPIVVEKTKTHDIYSLDGKFFAVPHTLGEIELTRQAFETQAGIVRSNTKEQLLEAIASSRQWADSRGQNDSQEKQRVEGSYLRAASASEGSETGTLPPNTRILRYRDTFVGFDKSELDKVFSEEDNLIITHVTETFIEPGIKGKPTELSDVGTNNLSKEEKNSLGLNHTERYDNTPALLGAIKKYNIVSYEGWIYGIPQNLGPMDLSEIDIMEMEGVIRDVSEYGVEAEIVARESEKSISSVWKKIFDH
jgi:hypothetical protein